MNMGTQTIPPEVTSLLREAAEWRLLGLLFEYPSEAWREQMAALLPDVAEAELRESGRAALTHASPGQHHALFGPGGLVPVREAPCQGGVQFGYLLAELAAYYDAFGPATTAEADDHLAVELGFLAYLKMKQALALATGDAGGAAVSAEAAVRFLRDHLRVTAEPAAQALAAHAPDYLAAVGQRLVERAGPAPRSAFPPATSPDRQEDSGEFVCGPAPPGVDFVRLAP